MALGAWVMLASVNGTRRVPLENFYTGVRKTVLQPDEMLVDIAFPALKTGQTRDFFEIGTAACPGNFAGQRGGHPDPGLSRVIKSAVITLGAVAPTIIHAPEAEAYLAGKELTDEVIAHAAELAAGASRPIDDIRGSAAYRKAMVRVLVMRGLRILRAGEEQTQVPETPVLLASNFHVSAPHRTEGDQITHQTPIKSIRTKINGKEYTFTTGHRKIPAATAARGSRPDRHKGRLRRG